MDIHKLNEDSVTLSLDDVVRGEEQLEECANAVLGGSDEDNCTYIEGYIGRQALYACLDCIVTGDTLAGICLACSLRCHSDHNLVELYTKRNFRCDCGNGKLKNECSFFKEKDSENANNKYNHNFLGKYCTCERPYPDPDNEDDDDDMIQCAVCEDWIHGRHSGVPLVPCSDQYEEFTCSACVKKLPFLQVYAAQLGIVEQEVDVESTPGPSCSDNVEKKSPGDKRPAQADNVSCTPEKKLKTTDGSDSAATTPTKAPVPERWCEGEDCRLALKRNSVTPTNPDHSVFWRENWREALCRCSACKDRYTDLGCSFLLDLSDTIASYEKQGQETKSTPALERGMKAFGQMDRVQQIELTAGFQNMKEGFRDYFKSFAEGNKVISREDIESFFAQLRKNKAAPSVPQYNCK